MYKVKFDYITAEVRLKMHGSIWKKLIQFLFVSNSIGKQQGR